MKKIPCKASSSFSIVFGRVNKQLPPKAYFLLVLVIILLAALAVTDFSARQPLLTEGEIAPANVLADKSFLFTDKQATAARKDLARKMQPLVLNLVTLPANALRARMQTLLFDINSAYKLAQKETLRHRISQEIGLNVSMLTLASLAAPEVQEAILSHILPQVEQRLHNGVLDESSLVQGYPGGVLIHNTASGDERLQPELYDVPDLKGLAVQVSQQIKELPLTAQGKQVLVLLFDSMLHPTLIPDYKGTRQRAEQMTRAVTPVIYRVFKGELIVQKGDRVSREQQIKMQVLLQRNADRFQGKAFIGTALCGLLISLGLLFSPSNRPGTPMDNKDFTFLATLLLLFSLASKGLAAHGAQIAAVSAQFLPESLAYAVPVAGAAALSSQIFSPRRYLVTGLLLAFFCTLMMKGGLPLFLFYFSSAMWITWLTSRGTSRRDVVWSLLPLITGLLTIWVGTSLMQGGAHSRYFAEAIAVATGAVLSIALSFALAPVVEMVFGYTTRFRLMELLNLEQPMLRELMLNAPGTYHHSLIVSNMCEAGAKRIGAYSLLCKVAALYHDIGKTIKADYFIENQPTEENPHNRLAPSMSALILISHVKQGIELARQYRLGQEITDIIRQHHGTSVIQYFYNKALNQVDQVPPAIEDYRYSGPRPKSKEAALVMLADIVEASSRTLVDPTPARLRHHIENILKSTYASGQMDETELTFRDLDNLADSFQQVLRGIFHHRISYSGGADKARPPVKPPTVMKAQPYPAEPATPARDEDAMHARKHLARAQHEELGGSSANEPYRTGTKNAMNSVEPPSVPQ